MGYTSSSGKHPASKDAADRKRRPSTQAPWFAVGARAAGEAALAAAAAAGALGLAPLGAPALKAARWGLSWAWAASAVGTFGLAYGLAAGLKPFWWAFGGGMLLRVAVLAALMARAWSHPEAPGEALLAGYALGVAGLLLVEYRQFLRG